MQNLKPESERGLFIVIYGANNLGKSEQTKQLAMRLAQEGHHFLKLKYALYGLEPTGPKINEILREGKEKGINISEKEFQKIYAQNRRDFQSTLQLLLNARINVLAEDYTGTGLAWGITRDVPIEELEVINQDLVIPDIAILLDGERFTTKVEKGHRNEDAGDIIWNKNREAHLTLAKRYSWNVVNANDTIESVHHNIWNIVSEKITQRVPI